MPRAHSTALSDHRQRLKHQGIVRVEVHVHKDDAALVRSVAQALSDPKEGADTRALLRARFAPQTGQSLKALLASAPLDGIELTRSRDTGRGVDL